MLLVFPKCIFALIENVFIVTHHKNVNSDHPCNFSLRICSVLQGKVVGLLIGTNDKDRERVSVSDTAALNHFHSLPVG